MTHIVNTWDEWLQMKQTLPKPSHFLNVDTVINTNDEDDDDYSENDVDSDLKEVKFTEFVKKSHATQHQPVSQQQQLVLDPLDESDLFDHLNINSEGKDFYAAIDKNQEEGVTAVWICPRAFFDYYGYVTDQTPNIDHLVPEDMLGELGESLFESEFDEEGTTKILTDLGFVFSQDFADFVNNEGE